MGKTRFMNLSVKHTQLLAYILFILSSLTAVFLIGAGKFGILIAQDIPKEVGHFNRFFFAVCSLASYLVLSQITANLATRKVIKNVGIFLFIIEILSAIFNMYNMNNELSSVAFSCYNAFFFVMKSAPILYLWGVIVRNNPDCKRAKVAINVMFAICFLFIYIAPQAMILIAPNNINDLEFLDVIQCLTYISCSYVLYTSEVFNGEISKEAAPKGAYRFWNKYFTWFIIVLFAMPILLIICGA